YVVVAIHQSAVITRRTLSLHDALPIYDAGSRFGGIRGRGVPPVYPRLFQGPALPCRWGGDHCSASRAGHPAHGRFVEAAPRRRLDRKRTRLNSSHVKISYAVFCLKKKK